MARKQHKPEEIVAKLRQVEVLVTSPHEVVRRRLVEHGCERLC